MSEMWGHIFKIGESEWAGSVQRLVDSERDYVGTDEELVDAGPM